MYQNSVSLIGFLGKNGEQKFTSNGTPVTVLSLATKSSWKNKETGEWTSHSEWHRFVCWGQLSTFAATLKSGAHLHVEGELRSREYQKDGVTHRIWECRASRLGKLDRLERADDSVSVEEFAGTEPPF